MLERLTSFLNTDWNIILTTVNKEGIEKPSLLLELDSLLEIIVCDLRFSSQGKPSGEILTPHLMPLCHVKERKCDKGGFPITAMYEICIFHALQSFLLG